MPATDRTDSAVGIFDSGVGGLAVYQAIRAALPGEDLIYVADTAFAPYGDKNAEYVERRTRVIAEFLTGVGVKAIVVACNTATAVAVRALRETYSLPVVGIEPGIKPAVERSTTGKIVVMATQRTIESTAVDSLLQRFGGQAEIILQACPGLAECVEADDTSSKRIQELLRAYTQPVRDINADVVVLGCTHYAFLVPQIRSLVGEGVTIVEPSHAVARQLAVRLEKANLVSNRPSPGTVRFFTSAQDSSGVAEAISRLLGRKVAVESLDEVR